MDSDLVVCCELEYEVTKPAPSYGHLSDLAEDISHFFTSKSIGDFTFVVDQKEFRADKAIVSARSPVLARMFQQDPKESALNHVDIIGIEPEIFQALLRFIYTDQVDLTIELAKALLAAADRLSLVQLKWKCEDFLVENMLLKNCCEFLGLAHYNGAINLKKLAMDEICKFSDQVMVTEEWKKLEKSCPEVAFETLETLPLLEKHYHRQQMDFS